MSDMNSIILERARSALWLVFTADALSMPVHWFYNPGDIRTYFGPDGITKMEPAPSTHPSSIMNLHSTSGGGRGRQDAGKQVVGDIILQGKRKFWGQSRMHYHNGLPAGEHTLNAYCARWMLHSLAKNGGRYSRDDFFNYYVEMMTADEANAKHPDTYAESYHRGFFANWAEKKPLEKCGAVTHDTPSVGGLVTVAPLAISELLVDRDVHRVQQLAREHLFMTHPDEGLAKICDDYVALMDSLLFRDQGVDGAAILKSMATKYIPASQYPLDKLLPLEDTQIIGRLFSPACYISDSWPSLLFLAVKYQSDPEKALLANTNAGGENCHRGSVLGSLVGLAADDDKLGKFKLTRQLRHKAEIEKEIEELLSKATSGAACKK